MTLISALEDIDHHSQSLGLENGIKKAIYQYVDTDMQKPIQYKDLRNIQLEIIPISQRYYS